MTARAMTAEKAAMVETTSASSPAAALHRRHVAPHARARRESPEKLKPSGVAAGQSKYGMEGGDAVERERAARRGKDGTAIGQG